MGWQDRDYSQADYNPRGGGFGGRGGGQMRFGNPLQGVSMVKWLLAINVGVFLIDIMVGGVVQSPNVPAPNSPTAWGAFTFESTLVHWQVWRWFTYQFLHGSLMHVLFNMIALFFFGPIMERWWGSKRFLAFYLLCGACGAWLYAVLVYLNVVGSGYLVGASGSIFGILAGCAMVSPNTTVLFMMFIPMRMRTMALLAIVFAAFVILTGGDNPGGQAAHLGGALFGFLLVRNPRALDFADTIGPRKPADRAAREIERREKKRDRKSEKNQAEVDRILTKVKEHGLHSLTEAEKKTLQRETDRQRRAS